MKFYFAAPWEYGPQLLPLVDCLKDTKHTVTSTWLTIPTETRSKNSLEAADYAFVDLADVDACNMLVLFNPKDYPMTPGRNIEFGYALAKGKALGLIGDRKGVFQHLPQIRYMGTGPQDFLDWLEVHSQLAY